MCSTFKFKNCMGRNYDYEVSYDEEVIFIPKEEPVCQNQYDIIGIGSGLFKDYPMLYDAMNSQGLCMSGLAFTDNAVYYPFNKSKLNIPVWNMIPYILGNSKSVKDFKNGFTGEYNLNITDTPFNEQTPNAELHWFLCDKEEAVVIESTEDGLQIYDNSLGTMTNNPPFNKQVEYCNIDFIGEDKENSLQEIGKEWKTRGLETLGLNGDYTSSGRFERLTWLKQKLEKYDVEDSVIGSFKLCQSVEQLYGCTPVGNKFEYTIYQSVYNMDELYLYTRKTNQLMPKVWTFGNSDEICRWGL